MGSSVVHACCEGAQRQHTSDEESMHEDRRETRADGVDLDHGSGASGSCSASVLPHMGQVNLDFDSFSGRFVLSHLITQERHFFAVPPGTEGDVDLIFDDDGFAALVGVSAEPKLVERILEEVCHISPEGRYIVMRKPRNDEFEGGVSCLEALLARYDDMTIRAPCGAAGGTMTLEGALFERRRHGQHLWLNLASVYCEAGFSFNVKYPSIWIHKRLRAWQSELGGLGLVEHVLRSKP